MGRTVTAPDSDAPNKPSTKPFPIASIVAMVGKGMTAREILTVFPELGPDDIRAALLRAAEVVCEANESLRTGEPVAEIIRQAQQGSDLSESDAMKLAVAETRAFRKEKATRR